MTLYEYFMLHHDTMDIFGKYCDIQGKWALSLVRGGGARSGVKTCPSPYKSRYKSYFLAIFHTRGR